MPMYEYLHDSPQNIYGPFGPDDSCTVPKGPLNNYVYKGDKVRDTWLPCNARGKLTDAYKKLLIHEQRFDKERVCFLIPAGEADLWRQSTKKNFLLPARLPFQWMEVELFFLFTKGNERVEMPLYEEEYTVKYPIKENPLQWGFEVELKDVSRIRDVFAFMRANGYIIGDLYIRCTIGSRFQEYEACRVAGMKYVGVGDVRDLL